MVNRDSRRSDGTTKKTRGARISRYLQYCYIWIVAVLIIYSVQFEMVAETILTQMIF